MEFVNSIVISMVLAVSLLILFCTAILSLMPRFSYRRKLIRKLQARETGLRRQAVVLQFASQEHTYRIISQEIHDNVGQVLSLAKLNLNIALQEQDRPTRLQEVKAQLNIAIAELRSLGAGNDAVRIVEKGLPAAIRYQLQQLEKTGMFSTSFTCMMPEPFVPGDKTLCLYRMVQEILCNIVKHSGGNKVMVKLYADKNGTHLQVHDNGRGFNTKHFKPGFGLSSLRQRAAMIGGKMEIQSAPDTGTTIRVMWK